MRTKCSRIVAARRGELPGAGKVGFDASNRGAVHPHDQRSGVRFATLRFASQSPPAPAGGLGVALTGTAAGTGVLRAVHAPTGRPLASAQIEWSGVQVKGATTSAQPNGALDAAELDDVWDEVRGKVSAGRRHAVVFFVPKLNDVEADGAKPVTVGTRDTSSRGLIAVSDGAVKPEDSLAHELGHLCGLDIGKPAHPSSRGFDRNIMFRTRDKARDTFYRDQIELMRKPPP